MSPYAGRRSRLRAALHEHGLSALVVSHLPNVRYLTGYVGSNAIAVVGPEGTKLLTDARYAVSAREQVDDDVSVIIGPGDLTTYAARVIAELAPGGAAGVEGVHVSMFQGERLAVAVAGADPAIVLTPHVGLVEQLRMVKDDGEIAAIARSAAITDAALSAVLEDGLIDRPEREVAFAIQTEMFRLGAEGPSFETIVAAGPNGAKPHAVPGARRIGAGELVVIDLGSIADGYCSDMTRTSITGDLPAQLSRAYRVCAEAQAAAVAAVRPGIACKDLDAIARDLITDAGFGEEFGHGLGHGVGLEIHEGPRVSREGSDILRPGMVVTIEPGIYIEGVGGVRIEDLVVVTDNGCRVLSQAPKASVSSGD